MIFLIFLIILIILIISSIKQINEYERGILFRFGKFNKVMNPGWNIVIPIIDFYKKVDIRTKAVDVPFIKSFRSILNLRAILKL